MAGSLNWTGLGRILLYASVTATLTLGLAALGSGSQRELAREVRELSRTNETNILEHRITTRCVFQQQAKALNAIEAKLGIPGPRVQVPAVPPGVDCTAVLANAPPQGG